MPGVFLWGWDRGAKVWRKVLVNPTGYLQTVVVSSALPAGGATEATLDLVRAELDGIEGLLGAGLDAGFDVANDWLSRINAKLRAGLPLALDTDSLKVREQNWPAEYPLSDAQIALLQAVDVANWPADPSTGGRQDVQTDLISLIRILLAARLPAIISVNVATTGKQAIAAASTAVLAANATRIFAQFVNDSDEEIYLDLSDTAVMNEGIRLNANGGAFEINQTNLYTGAIAAICASGGKNLTVTEG